MTRSEKLEKAIERIETITLRQKAAEYGVTYYHDPLPIDQYELILSLILAEQKRKEGCAFCCYTEYPDATLYPREKREFYAGRSRQVNVDEFDEDELDDVSFCPHCGRDLTEGESA